MSKGVGSFPGGRLPSSGYLPEGQPAPQGRHGSPPPALAGLMSNSSTWTSGSRSTSTPSWSNFASTDELPAQQSGSPSVDRGPIRRTVTLPAPVQHYQHSLHLGPAPSLTRSTTDTSRTSSLADYSQPHERPSECNRLGSSSHLRRLTGETATGAPDKSARSLVTSVAKFVEASSSQRITSTSVAEPVETLPSAPQPVHRDNARGRTSPQSHVLAPGTHVNGKHRAEDDEDADHGKSVKTPANIKKKRTPRPAPRTSRPSHRPGRKYEMQWRLGAAPMAVIKESKEQANFGRVLTAISNYHQGNAGGIWRTVMQQNAAGFDGNGLCEAMAVSIMLAAGFISSGQPDTATQVLDRTLPLARALLLSQHPQLCYYFNEISMDTSNTVAGSVRASWKSYLLPLAIHTLGERHPISILLGTPLTTEQKMRMRREGQRVAHQEHLRAFGTYSYQTMVHLWYWARLTAASGDVPESIRMLESVVQAWEQVYSANSAVAITAIVEQARVMLASGDASVKVECLLSDALRRNDVLISGQVLQPQFMDAAEARLRESCLIFCQLAAFRCLGRLHVMRHNLGNAKCCLQQALSIAQLNLAEDSSVTKLCKTDLVAVELLQLEEAMGSMTLTDPISRLPPITSIIPFAPVD
ncbi:hypothetical protein AYO21_00727 [Fonsecaea monophora]|uniref:Uncharacterized protein n=1 Tax=Fonsecaea monophora TaxID=254056 RepID=A0A177FKP1_9EURO|nr:hypothetical protein AYO21_00727 [Fonsecaea monophora]KAH0848494.1 hypothetical protein FOPE_02506 [Fonsecaea pedrosoi]OAG44767.1 hypothetical protein AYO21_00727 [Fonsecaea monophora]